MHPWIPYIRRYSMDRCTFLGPASTPTTTCNMHAHLHHLQRNRAYLKTCPIVLSLDRLLCCTSPVDTQRQSESVKLLGEISMAGPVQQSHARRSVQTCTMVRTCSSMSPSKQNGLSSSSSGGTRLSTLAARAFSAAC